LEAKSTSEKSMVEDSAVIPTRRDVGSNPVRGAKKAEVPKVHLPFFVGSKKYF